MQAQKNVAVCSFEPSPVNFYLLAANLRANNSHSIQALPFSLSSDRGVFKWCGSISPGEAGENCQIDKKGPLALQVYSMDTLIKDGIARFPNHIKIDVDGFESKIIDGGRKTLKDDRLKLIMFEVDESNPTTTDMIIESLKEDGFSNHVKRHSPYFNDNQYLPSANYLFRKV